MNTSIKGWLTWPVSIGIVVLIVALSVGGTYNRLVRQNEAATAQWAQVESQYQRRYDLIPNLVSATQGAMKQETAVFSAIAEARTRYAGATTPDEKARAAGQLEGSLGRLLVVMEQYPSLKSLEVVEALMAELAGTENRVAVERMRYNETVQQYNTAVKMYPSAFVAQMFGFSAREMFAAEEGAATAPKVSL